jgi:hypothetical protein
MIVPGLYRFENDTMWRPEAELKEKNDENCADTGLLTAGAVVNAAVHRATAATQTNICLILSHLLNLCGGDREPEHQK